MMEDGIEYKVLKKFKDSLVVRNSELIQLIQNEVKCSGDSVNIVKTLTKNFIQKGWITPLYASESTFAITQRGIKA
jgi:hypothetical protein